MKEEEMFKEKQYKITYKDYIWHNDFNIETMEIKAINKESAMEYFKHGGHNYEFVSIEEM